uniref:Uncharacterized protein n=1 Tax=Physcomitrium patens TaxID=3218 RepID=A0A2K1KXL7_PHYPA|nr:hypothetical protein PHYPA_005528 [Physcomitrium patens]
MVGALISSSSSSKQLCFCPFLVLYCRSYSRWRLLTRVRSMCLQFRVSYPSSGSSRP